MYVVVFLVFCFCCFLQEIKSFFWTKFFRFNFGSFHSWTCGRNRDHGSNGRYTQNSSVSLTVRVGITFGAHTPFGPSACVLWRVVNMVRFLKACLFATLILPRRTFAERRRAENSTNALAHPPCGHGVTAAPRPAPLAKQWVPQDSRQDADRGDLKHYLEPPGFIWRSIGIRRAPSNDTCLENWKRSSFGLNVGIDT